MRKPVFRVSDQVRHKPSCTTTEDRWRLEISDLDRRLYYPCSENKDADQLRGYREADLRLCFHICKKPSFSRRGSIKPPSSIILRWIEYVGIFLLSVFLIVPGKGCDCCTPWAFHKFVQYKNNKICIISTSVRNSEITKHSNPRYSNERSDTKDL